nr:ATP-binding cassette domain-containing protein [Kiritimatiellia bacterium]
MNAGSGPVIDVCDVCFAYSGQEVLHNVTFSVAPRALVAVVGPNGGGKTTLLKLLLGEHAPRYGTIRVL